MDNLSNVHEPSDSEVGRRLFTAWRDGERVRPHGVQSGT